MQLCSSTTNAAVVMRTRNQFGKRAFSVAGPSIWNHADFSPHQEVGTFILSVFRKALKIRLFWRQIIGLYPCRQGIMIMVIMGWNYFATLTVLLTTYQQATYVIGCLHDPANVQHQHVYFEYICWKFAERLLDRVNTPLRLCASMYCVSQTPARPAVAPSNYMNELQRMLSRVRSSCFFLLCCYNNISYFA